MLWKNRNRPLGGLQGLYIAKQRIFELIAPKIRPNAFAPGGVFGAVVSVPIPFITIIFGASLGAQLPPKVAEESKIRVRCSIPRELATKTEHFAHSGAPEGAPKRSNQWDSGLMGLKNQLGNPVDGPQATQSVRFRP